MIALLLAAALAATPGDIVKIEVPGQASPSPDRLRVDLAAGAAVPVTVSFRTLPPSATFSLYQVAGKIAAPVIENREMAREGDGFRAVLETPPTTAPRRYLLRVKAARADAPIDIDVFAYPSDLPDRVRRLVVALARNGKGIGLFGPGSAVRGLLAVWKVPFAEAGPDSAVAIGDFIGNDLDGAALPESGAPRALFLTTAPQADGTGALVRIQTGENRKLLFASGHDWAGLATNPAVQYRFVTLLSQTLPSP